MENSVEALPEGGGAQEELPASPLTVDINKEPRTPPDSPARPPSTPNGQSCPVCLGPIDNVSFTDTCAHEFCFACLVQWSRVKPECPLCKRRFQVIMYNVKSAIDFSRLPVTDIEPERPEPAFEFPDLRLFRYPTTMSSSSDFIRRNQNREVAAIRRRLQQMIDEMRQRSLEHMRLRLYRNRLKSVVPSNGRVRDATPNFFRRYPASIHRLVPFLNRELRVLFDNDNREVTRMLQLINSLLPRFPIMSEEFINAVRPFLGSRAKRFCQELLTFAKCPYDLAGYDRNAIYEADSPPIDVDAEPDPPNIAALIASPEFNPSIGVRTSFADFVSSAASASGPSTSTAARLAPASTVASYTIEISSDSSSDESENDEVGSWIEIPSIQRVNVTAEPRNEQPPPQPPQIDRIRNPSESGDSDNSDCQIVGFDKAWEQRTPVLLTSESEQEVDVGGGSDERQPQNEQKPPCLNLRKRHHSNDLSSSSDDEYPSPEALAARGKRWSPHSLLEAAAIGSTRSSFFPTLLSTSSDVNLDDNKNSSDRTMSSPSSLSSPSSSPSIGTEFTQSRMKTRQRSRLSHKISRRK